MGRVSFATIKGTFWYLGCERNHTKKIKFLFSNGSTERRVSTNTSDKKLVIKRKMP